MSIRSFQDSVQVLVRAALGTSALAFGAPLLAADDDESLELERVEVTGSRIKRVQIEGAAPVTTITRADIERTGIPVLGDLLQEITEAGPAINTNFNNGGDGSTQLDLRNLGTHRLLVLINGRRTASLVDWAGATDFNTIPLAIVERVEVLKDGASVLYGADAIAGVVNIVTRKDFDGASANAMRGKFAAGDGRQEVYDFSIGTAGPRSSAFLNASYYQQGVVAAGDRNISREPLFGTGLMLGSSSTPMGRFRIPDAGVPFSAPGATRSTGGDFTPSVGDFRSYIPEEDAYNFAPDNYLATPSERWALYAQGSHELSDNLAFTAEVFYSRRKSEQLLAAVPLNVGRLQAVRADGQLIGIAASNPFNIFGVELDPDQADPGLWLQGLQRRLVETGGRSFNQDVGTFRFASALEGNFEALGRLWDWNAGWVFASSERTDLTHGQLSTTAVRTALGPISACLSPCVPLNLFGGAGSVTRSMLNYVEFNQHDVYRSALRDLSINLSGELWELPAGPLGMALGFEQRRVSGQIEPDANVVAGNTTSLQFDGVAGGSRIDEQYVELAVPVVRDARLAEMLEFSVAARRSDDALFGSTTNSKYGFRWQPTTDLLLRGTRQQGLRAPSTFERFLQRVLVPLQGSDPCSVAAAQGGPPGSTGSLNPIPSSSAEAQLYANCTGVSHDGDFIGADGAPGSDGVNETYSPLIRAPVVPVGSTPAGFYGQTDSTLPFLRGGNPALQPERSTTRTLGLVYSPAYISGLSVTLDWYRFEVEEAITIAGETPILDNCYVLSVQGYCELIQRYSTGEVEQVEQTYANLAVLKAEGVDLNVVYHLGEWPGLPGEWRFYWSATWLRGFELCDAGICTEFVRTNPGDSALPAFKSSLIIDWASGPWEAVWRMRFIGRQYELCSSSYTAIGFPCSDVTSNENRLGAATYHNVQVSYHFTEWDARFTFGIQNVGGKQPPLSAQAFANSFDATTYEVPGQFPYLRISKAF